MKRCEPPRLAQWLLMRCASPYKRQAFADDLLELYRSGYSKAWYWRQVIVALVLARARSVRLLLEPCNGVTLFRLINAFLLACALALGIGSITEADTLAMGHHFVLR